MKNMKNLFRCPNCGSFDCVKNGKVIRNCIAVGGKAKVQRYKCKICSFNYSRDEKGFITLKKKCTIIKAYFRDKKLNKTAKNAGISRVTLDAWLNQIIKNIQRIDEFKEKFDLRPDEFGKLNYFKQCIDKKNLKHPLMKKQIIELSYMHKEALFLLLKYNPKDTE